MTMRMLRCKPFCSRSQSFLGNDAAVDKLESATTALLAKWQDCQTRSQNTSFSTPLPYMERLLALHAWIVGSAMSEPSKPVSDMVFVEYGGGRGFQSLLARQLGIGTVVYNDIDPSACESAEGIAEELGLKADFYVRGDVDGLVQFLEMHQVMADAITSHDVLEHVYDIDYFLERLNTICGRDAVLMLCSGANMFWYPFAKHAAKMQKQAENIGLEEYKVGAFLKERMKIIREFAPSLSEDEVQRLGICTRGLVSRDIARVADRYLQTGQVPKVIEHPTNTCNPYTGSWAERSMNPYYIAEALALTGFDAIVLPVPFEKTGSFGNDLLRSVLNIMIRLSGRNVGLYFSHAYAIHARYTGTSRRESHKQHMYAHSVAPVFRLVELSYELVSLFYPRRSFYSPQFGRHFWH